MPPATVQNYRITAVLGSGGMGSVYLGEHQVMNRRAAVKVLKRELAEDKAVIQRFFNEAHAINAIRHPNIIEIVDAGLTSDGLPYLITELLEGETLGRRLERCKRLSVEEAVAIACQAASALSAAHAQGIVHRDLKPENLFLVPQDNNPASGKLKVLDFGIAKLRPQLSGGSLKTGTGALLGTPRYMSPEQCRGVVSEIDHRTDVYSLGIVLYEMLAGQPPFVADGFGDLLMMHMSREPTSPRRLNPEIPSALEKAILAALAKEAGGRPSTMEAFRDALGPWSGHSIPPPPPLSARQAGGDRDTEVLPAPIATMRLEEQPSPSVPQHSRGPATTLSSSVNVLGRSAPQPGRWKVGFGLALAVLAVGTVVIALLAEDSGRRSRPGASAAPGAGVQQRREKPEEREHPTPPDRSGPSELAQPSPREEGGSRSEVTTDEPAPSRQPVSRNSRGSRRRAAVPATPVTISKPPAPPAPETPASEFPSKAPAAPAPQPKRALVF